MKWFVYTAIIIALLVGGVFLHAYFLNQQVCGANAQTYSSYYALNAAKQWIVNTGQCSIARPITIDSGSDMHDVLTQPFWLQKAGYIGLQIVSKGFGLVTQ